MTSLEDLFQAAMAAPPERREAALRLLRGQLPSPEPTFTLSGLARQMGLCRATLRRWGIPGLDLGGHRRYRRSEVEAYLASDDFKRRLAGLRAQRRERFAGISRTSASPSIHEARNSTVARVRVGTAGRDS